MDQILGQILRLAVWERLDLLDELATHADERSLVSVARTELPRLTEGWRALLVEHEPDDKGNCRSCSSRWRAQKAPCSVWQAAHQHLVADHRAQARPTQPTQPTQPSQPTQPRPAPQPPVHHAVQSGRHTAPQPVYNTGPQPAYQTGPQQPVHVGAHRSADGYYDRLRDSRRPLPVR